MNPKRLKTLYAWSCNVCTIAASSRLRWNIPGVNASEVHATRSILLTTKPHSKLLPKARDNINNQDLKDLRHRVITLVGTVQAEAQEAQEAQCERILKIHLISPSSKHSA